VESVGRKQQIIVNEAGAKEEQRYKRCREHSDNFRMGNFPERADVNGEVNLLNKLKNTFIDRMVENQLSSTEIDFILYIANYQNDFGAVASVYYKDVCSAIHISVQKFYDIIASLSKKKLLDASKINPADICIRLLGNDFSAGDYSQGYLKVASIDFQDEKFRHMKAGSKLLFLYMQRFVQGKHMLISNFYETFCALFHKSKKSMQNYLRELKKNFYLFISKKRNKAYNYEMTIKKSTLMVKPESDIPLEKKGLQSNFKKLVYNNFKKYIPKSNGDKVLEDIAGLIITKKTLQLPDAASRLVAAIKESVEQQRSEGKKNPVLNAALVNRIFSSSF